MQFALQSLYFSSNADSKEGTEISPWKMYKHVQIKPQRTDLPKPKIARSGGGRNVHFTDDWKRYATTIYPIDPSRYWNLPQAQYDLLIPVNSIVQNSKLDTILKEVEEIICKKKTLAAF